MKKNENNISILIHIDNYTEIPPTYRILPKVKGKRYISIDANDMKEALDLYNAAIKELNKK